MSKENVIANEMLRINNNIIVNASLINNTLINKDISLPLPGDTELSTIKERINMLEFAVESIRQLEKDIEDLS